MMVYYQQSVLKELKEKIQLCLHVLQPMLLAVMIPQLT